MIDYCISGCINPHRDSLHTENISPQLDWGEEAEDSREDHIVFHLLEAAGIIVSCAVPATKTAPTSLPDLTSNPLVDVVIGGFIAAGASFLVSFFSNRQQLKRDQQAHEHQLEREHLAYERSVKDAKTERLRNAYKVIRNAADRYQVEVQQINHVASLANISLTGVDEAIIEITLEDVGNDVVTIFSEMRGAFNEFSARWHMPEEGSWEEVLKRKETVFEKIEELTAAMQKHLKELES